jgi:hypothetical protein
MAKWHESTQRTPRGEEIPIPKRRDFLKNLLRLAKRKPDRSTTGGRPKK